MTLLVTLYFLTFVTTIGSISSFMKIQSSFVISASLYHNSSLSEVNQDARLTAPQLIMKYGYPVETHLITTEDGYILAAHRIPYGKKCGPGNGKRVVWVQHGLLCDSSCFIISGPVKGLGYNLADECYDVWLGNFRGNTYSKRHLYLDPVKSRKDFWSFSWNELGLYDLPACIDYVMNVTGTDGIYYIGHSMATTAFWVCMSERPEYNSKIKLMSALAPVAYTEHLISPIRMLAPFAGRLEWLLRWCGIHELLPSTRLSQLFGQTACQDLSLVKEQCSDYIFLLGGFNYDQLDRDVLSKLLGHVPAGTSVRTVAHFAQGVYSGKFRKFNFGHTRNRRVYGVPVPPSYPLENVTAPVALYWSENDWLAHEIDVFRLVTRLANVKRVHRIQLSSYNHADFMIAKDNLQLLNRPVIDFMKLYE